MRKIEKHIYSTYYAWIFPDTNRTEIVKLLGGKRSGWDICTTIFGVNHSMKYLKEEYVDDFIKNGYW